MESFLSGADACRIENTAGSGTPDINACYNGIELWIETKIMQPKGVVHIRPYQYAWIRRRVVSGGKVFILAYDPLSDNVYCYRGLGLSAMMSTKKGHLEIRSHFFAMLTKTHHLLDLLNYDKVHI